MNKKSGKISFKRGNDFVSFLSDRPVSEYTSRTVVELFTDPTVARVLQFHVSYLDQRLTQKRTRVGAHRIRRTRRRRRRRRRKRKRRRKKKRTETRFSLQTVRINRLEARVFHGLLHLLVDALASTSLVELSKEPLPPPPPPSFASRIKKWNNNNLATLKIRWGIKSFLWLLFN